MTDQQHSAIDVFLYRRRASDRARERAGRAAWYGDRAGLLIATGEAAAGMSLRVEAEQAARRATDESARS